MMVYPALYSAPFGPMTLTFDRSGLLTALDLHGHEADAPYPLPECWRQRLDGYFSGRLKSFDCPPSSDGTPFQHRVWQAIAAIPYGCVRTYQDIAREIGSHPRAVGAACGKNPLVLVVPCHRVVAKNGLGGFSSGGSRSLAVKRWLLRHEGIILADE
ncbi:methylated-DNA--[protein]-cysteine S-methyltransferase [Neisseria leonii]|uniref:methylated-DNA--[protein]-cysteine S-methyltransferase n=1 Tax=Neisseria leonii TaxID=2995413 RepID=UPI0030CA9954